MIGINARHVNRARFACKKQEGNNLKTLLEKTAVGFQEGCAIAGSHACVFASFESSGSDVDEEGSIYFGDVLSSLATKHKDVSINVKNL